MIEAIGNVQTFVLGVVLLGSGLSKTAGWSVARSQPDLARQPRWFLDARWSSLFFRAVGLVELGLAALLLLVADPTRPMQATTGLMTVFVAYLFLLRKKAPDASCGCIGFRQVPVSARTIARACLLMILSVVGWNGSDGWLPSVFTSPGMVSLAAGELALIFALSPELHWNRHKARKVPSSSQDCTTIPISFEETFQQLRASEVFRRLEAYTTGELRDHWRQGCWRFFSYPSMYDSRETTTVYAVRILGTADESRAAIVDNKEDAILLAVGGTDRDPATRHSGAVVSGTVPQ